MDHQVPKEVLFQADAYFNADASNLVSLEELYGIIENNADRNLHPFNPEKSPLFIDNEEFWECVKSFANTPSLLERGDFFFSRSFRALSEFLILERPCTPKEEFAFMIGYSEKQLINLFSNDFKVWSNWYLSKARLTVYFWEPLCLLGHFIQKAERDGGVLELYAGLAYFKDFIQSNKDKLFSVSSSGYPIWEHEYAVLLIAFLDYNLANKHVFRFNPFSNSPSFWHTPGPWSHTLKQIAFGERSKFDSQDRSFWRERARPVLERERLL